VPAPLTGDWMRNPRPPDCATRPSTIDSPSQFRSGALVVKNGSVGAVQVTSSLPLAVSG